MQTKGKFYIAMTGASATDAFWMRDAQNWTTDPRRATFFEARDEADREHKYARDYGPGETEVRQATSDIS